MDWDDKPNPEIVDKLVDFKPFEALSPQEVSQRRVESCDSCGHNNGDREPTLHTIVCFMEDNRVAAAERRTVFETMLIEIPWLNGL